MLSASLWMSARPSWSPSTPMVAQVAGMNCISPCAPAELVWLLRPCPVSSMPIPASSVQGILYLSAAARYSFLIFGGMGSGGLCSEFAAGFRGVGSGTRHRPPQRRRTGQATLAMSLSWMVRWPCRRGVRPGRP